MRILLALALVLLAAPVVGAQTTASPIQGAYHEVYVISGRALDSAGDPVAGGRLTIEIVQDGVTAAPLQATANCKGDFITSFTLRYVDPKGKANIVLKAPEGGNDAKATVSFDPFFRRSDTVLRLDTPWNAQCAPEQDVFDVSASMAVRLLNRTLPYQEGEYTFEARPYTGFVRLRYETADGEVLCPPHPQSEDPNQCELFVVDERGDMRYTFTLDQPFPAGGRVQVILQDNKTFDVPIDPVTRIGVRYFEVSGQGPPERNESPAPAFAVLLVALVGLALARKTR